MNYNFELIKKNLNKKGFFIVKNFLSSSDLDKKFTNYLYKKEKFVDGVIHGLNTKFYININKKIKKISQGLNNKDLNISSNKFCYASIRIKKTTNPKFYSERSS